MSGQAISDRLQIARRFALAAYSSLLQPDALVEMTVPKAPLATWPGIHEVTLRLFEGGLEDRDGAAPVATIDFGFSESPTSMHALVNGPLVNGERNANAVALLRSHPEWTNDEVLNAFAREGANFLPGSTPPLAIEQKARALESYLGTMKIESVEFLVRSNIAKVAGGPMVVSQWFVRGTAAGPLGHPGHFVVRIEPFTGRIVAFGFSDKPIH